MRWVCVSLLPLQAISAQIAALMAGPLKEALAEQDTVLERDGRFLLAVKPSHKAGVGIVHDASRTRRTLYVEPKEVVEQTNNLKEAQLALRSEEARILNELSRLFRLRAFEVGASLDAAALVDLAVARSRLGRLLGGTIPEVGAGGVMTLNGFKHPLLQLRHAKRRLAASSSSSQAASSSPSLSSELGAGGSGVVGNDLRLNATAPGLVLTGPNAGGKTVGLRMTRRWNDDGGGHCASRTSSR